MSSCRSPQGLPRRSATFHCFCQPRIQGRNAPRLYRGEADAHSCTWSRIRDLALGGENRPVVSNLEPDVRSGLERRDGLNKAAEEAQVLGVRRDLSPGVERRHLDPGDEWETLRPMALERDDGTSIVSRILFQPETTLGIKTGAGGHLVNSLIVRYTLLNRCGSHRPAIPLRDTKDELSYGDRPEA
jgi:hypothetical protein